MPKSDTQQPAKPESSGASAKRPGVRKLQDLEDLRRLQAKLLKQFLCGEMNRDDFKTAMYGTTCLCATMKELKPVNGMADVTTALIVELSSNANVAEFITQMNTNILPPPEENADA